MDLDYFKRLLTENRKYSSILALGRTVKLI
jgi:hypothetical protein